MRSFALALIAVTAVACATPTTDTVVTTTAVPVATVEAAAVDWTSRYEAGGTLTARETALISSRIVAPISAVMVRAGDLVTRGQTLVVLETAELAAQASRAAAALDAARQAGEAASADAKSAEAAVVLTRAAHGRIATLHGQRSATSQELDEATAALGMAEARLAGARARVREATSALDAARSARRGADVATSYGTLTAPFAGVVASRSVDPGTMAAPGVSLLVLENPRGLTLEVRLDASRAAGVQLQDPVPVQIGSDTAPWAGGRVVEIARVDPTALSFAVKISVPPNAALRSGLYGRARFPGGSRQAIAVPLAAVIRRGQLTFVFAVDKDHVARLRAVSPGSMDDDRVEILAGLAAGERVVIAPPASLTDGARVTAADAPDPARGVEAKR
jgi:RND family efflux transporter MFP subunit